MLTNTFLLSLTGPPPCLFTLSAPAICRGMYRLSIDNRGRDGTYRRQLPTVTHNNIIISRTEADQRRTTHATLRQTDNEQTPRKYPQSSDRTSHVIKTNNFFEPSFIHFLMKTHSRTLRTTFFSDIKLNHLETDDAGLGAYIACMACIV